MDCETEEVGGTTFEYDLNGNLVRKDDGSVTTEYEWNDKNGLIGVAVDDSTVWQSTYYPNGKRWCRTNTDGSIYYLYDGGKAIGTYDTDWARREAFGYGLGSRDPIVNTQYYDGTASYYYVKDGKGNVNMILNAGEATVARCLMRSAGSCCRRATMTAILSLERAAGSGTRTWAHISATTSIQRRARRWAKSSSWAIAEPA